MPPAMVEGVVAPAMPADSRSTGIPPRMHISMVSQLSVANFIGGTTKQLELHTKGRSRHLSSPPAIIWRSSKDFATWDGSEKDVPTCFVVPAQQA